MDPGNHPDPFAEAMSHGLQRAVQMASCAVTAAQVYVYQQRTQARMVAERDQQARRALSAQARADRDASRAGWAPALGSPGLRQAGLVETARAWGAAAPFADRSVPWYKPAAAAALRASEEQLRVLHPQAMARYDQLRADGIPPAEAMREAAPLFSSATAEPDAGQRAVRLAEAWDVAESEHAATARAGRTARPWERDFPMPIQDVVATAGSATQTAGPSSAAPRAPARPVTLGPGQQP